jgi:hypothetical protein
VIANASLIRKVVVKPEKRGPKRFAARLALSARPNLSPVAVRLRLLTRSRRDALLS